MNTDNYEDFATGFSKVALALSKETPLVGAAKHKKSARQDDDVKAKTFDAKKGPPKISLLNYVKRIYHYGLESREELLPCFAAALVLLRLIACSVKLTSLNIHRVVALCFLVVTKHSTEYYGGDSHWADVLGIDSVELKRLEEDFYDVTDCQVEVTTEEVEVAERDIAAALKQATKAPLVQTTGCTVLDSLTQSVNEHRQLRSGRESVQSAIASPMRDSSYMSSCPDTDEDSPATVARTTPPRRKKKASMRQTRRKEAQAKEAVETMEAEEPSGKELVASSTQKNKAGSTSPDEDLVSCIKDCAQAPADSSSPRKKKAKKKKPERKCFDSADCPILGGTALGLLQQNNYHEVAVR